MGYRYLEKYNIKPRFAFGHGLSYATFQYNNVSTSVTGEEMLVKVSITNSSNVAGAEIVQLYVDMPDGVVSTPAKQLKGFAKVELQAGETKVAFVRLKLNAFQYYNESIHSWEKIKGKHTLLIGSSSDDIHLKEEVNIE